MRIGKNPNRQKPLTDNYPDVLAAVVVHLPEEAGYHQDRFEIVTTSLNSLRANAYAEIYPDPPPVLIWDNGSCERMRDWLVNEYRPEFLILSPNVGKTNAQVSIGRMLPPNTKVAYADDDMFYMPGWFDHQMKLYDAVSPNEAFISGYPVRAQFHPAFNKTTLEWAETNGAMILTGDFIPETWNRDFLLSVGRDSIPEKWRNQDVIIEYEGLRAFATAHHCQFITRAAVIAELKTFTEDATVNEHYFDRDIDKAGILRLTTAERLTLHMGNVIDDGLRKIIQENMPRLEGLLLA